MHFVPQLIYLHVDQYLILGYSFLQFVECWHHENLFIINGVF